MKLISKTNPTRNKQRGITSLELGVGLAVMAIIIGGLAPILYDMYKQAEASSAARITQSYFTGMHAKWRKGPFTGLNTAWAISAGIPNAADVSGSTVLNTWGQSMTFAAGTLTGGVTNGARQITDPVDPSACLQYVTDMAEFVDEVIVGSTTVKGVGSKLNTATATTACDVSSNTVNVIMRKA